MHAVEALRRCVQRKAEKQRCRKESDFQSARTFPYTAGCGNTPCTSEPPGVPDENAVEVARGGLCDIWREHGYAIASICAVRRMSRE